MSDRFDLVADVRTVTGKKVKQLRREGLIPAVIYGQSEPKIIQIENLSLRRALRTAGTSSLIDIAIGDQKLTVLAREIQAHATRGELIHVDFFEVNMKETIITEATLVTTGAALPVVNGLGSIDQALYTIEIECLPGDLISEIMVDLSQIQTPEDAIYVRDLSVPGNVTILNDFDDVVIRFEYNRVEEEEESEEEEDDALFAATADAVEVIGREEDEE